MFISLDQSIEIHAKALFESLGQDGAVQAIKHAEILKKRRDHEGYLVWIKVAKKITSYYDRKNTSDLDNYDGIIMDI